MNPWMILGLLAGVYGISRIAQSSTAAAQAANGVAAQGRIVSTDANGMTIAYTIPTGGTHQIKQRGTNAMVTVANFSPTKKFTVPWTAAIIQTQKQVRVYNSNGVGTSLTPAARPVFVYSDGNQKVAIPADVVGTSLGKAHFTGTSGSGTASAGASATVAQAIKDAQALIQSASQASDAGSWASSNAGQIAKVVAEIAGVIATASTADQATLNALKGQLESLGIQTGVKVATDVVQALSNS